MDFNHYMIFYHYFLVLPLLLFPGVQVLHLVHRCHRYPSFRDDQLYPEDPAVLEPETLLIIIKCNIKPQSFQYTIEIGYVVLR